MAKITSADRIKAIVTLCADPKTVRDAYSGAGRPEKNGELPEGVTDADIVTQCCAPANWTRTGKLRRWDRSRPFVIERCYECKPFDDQLRAYVTEEDGQITDVYLSNAAFDASFCSAPEVACSCDCCAAACAARSE